MGFYLNALAAAHGGSRWQLRAVKRPGAAANDVRGAGLSSLPPLQLLSDKCESSKQITSVDSVAVTTVMSDE